jgi:hypothetical protein
VGTGGHARSIVVARFLLICAVFVVARPRACLAYPPPNFDGKEPAMGSSPTEGLKGPANQPVLLPV